MTAVVSRLAPSPVPLAERDTPRNIARNPWVKRPKQAELEALFGIKLSAPPTDSRRPSPRRSA